MKKKNLIVLDIDDTLTSSEKKHTDSLLYAMNQMGIYEIDTNWKNYKNATDSYIVKVNYEKTFNKEFSLDLLVDFENIMTTRFLEYEDSKEIVGAKKMVDFIVNETEFGVCYATGSLFKPALLKLQQAAINFSEEVLEASNKILTREGIVNSAIDKAKEIYDVENFEHIISFGDGLWDVTTAKNLGVHFVGVNEKNKMDFEAQKVAYFINDWTEFDLKEAKNIFNII